MATGRRCCRPFSRGTTLVLASSALLYLVQWCLFDSFKLSLQGSSLQYAFTYAYYAIWIMLPWAGWAAESWMGRYKAIVTGLLICAVTVLLAQLAFIMLSFDWTPIPAFILLIIASINGVFGFGSMYTIMLPFTLDQMIGASAEELSAAVQWYYWCFILPALIENLLHCIPMPSEHLIPKSLPAIYLVISSLSFSAALIMDCLCHKWLDTHDKTGNPIKLIYQVLNYARKNKCPRLRSALTYIDEEHPSRIDFGKHKFGGPFTEEEVEDVKTVFRLTPLLLVSVFGVYMSIEFYDQLSLHAISTTKQNFFCVQSLKYTGYHASAVSLVPVYRFILYPLIGKFIPSTLKIIAAGFCLCIAVTVIELNILSISHFYSNASHCIFNDHTVTGTIPIPLYWVLIIDLVNGVGVALVLCSLFEFVIAQSPNRMRGIMMGLMITTIGIGTISTFFFSKIFQQFQTASPSCVFYYYLVLSLLLLLILIVFVILAKRYKLRERERHVNTHTIVEEHYERYYEQKEEYKKTVVHNDFVIESY